MHGLRASWTQVDALSRLVYTRLSRFRVKYEPHETEDGQDTSVTFHLEAGPSRVVPAQDRGV